MKNEKHSPIILTLDQAVKIREDFNHLEGELVESHGLELEINRIIVGPGDQKIQDFIEAYYRDDFESRDDEELLAASFQPTSYNVFTLYHEHNGGYIRETIFETLQKLEIEISLHKYKIQ